MDKILQALNKLLPENQAKDIASAVEEYLEEAKAELEGEFNQKLEQAYAELSSELKLAEETAEKGYQEAWAIISDQKNRMEALKTEYETAIEEGYEEAYQMLNAEKAKNEQLSTEIYAEYDKKLAEMREHMIDKFDEFMQYKGKELYEQAKRDVLNDPRMAEHKVALEKIVDTVSDYISDDEYAMATNSKLEESRKAIEELKGQVRILEARNIKFSTENTKLTETVRQKDKVLMEQAEKLVTEEKKERSEKAKNVQGRGRQVTENVEVIRENNVETDTTNQDVVSEGLDANELHQMQVLSGLKRDN